MFARLLTLLALLMPAAAMAQVAPRVTTVEIVATGEFDAPASAYILTATWSATGEDKEAARQAQKDKQADVRGALGSAGVSDSAITITPGTDFTTSYDQSIYSNMVVYDGSEEMNMTVDLPTEDPKPLTSVTDKLTVRVASFAQVVELREKFAGLDVEVTAATPVLDDPDSARRKAKTLALTSARGDADAYAAAMGMRVIRVSRISEAGNGLLLPGLQDKMSRLFSGGPEAMMRMFEPKPGFVHIEVSIIVEFELIPVPGAAKS